MKLHFRFPRGIVLAVLIVIALTAGLGTDVFAQMEEDNDESHLFLPQINGTQNVEDEYFIIEEDIQIPVDYFETRTNGVDATFATNLWPNGNVPFEFDANVTAANQQAMVTAMAEWERVATVDFQQCANIVCTGNYVHIQNSTANNSAVGMQGGRQVINIVSWGARFIIAHELAHTLGYWHEQSRPDRGSFIQVNLQNVCKATDTACSGGFCLDNLGNRIDCDFNFNIQNNARTYGTYDFESLMHYRRTTFSRNGSDTITVLSPYLDWQTCTDPTDKTCIGQRDHLSKMDALTMSFLYPQAIWRFVNIAYTGGQSGTFLAPYRQLAIGVTNTPNQGTLWLQPGTYSAAGTYSKVMTIRAPLGNVVLR